MPSLKKVVATLGKNDNSRFWRAYYLAVMAGKATRQMNEYADLLQRKSDRGTLLFLQLENLKLGRGRLKEANDSAPGGS